MLRLTEYEQSAPVLLNREQQILLRDLFGASISPSTGGKVTVTPGSRVGRAQLQGLTVVVSPKIPIRRLLSMIAEAADPYRWLQLDVDSLVSEDVQDSMAALFVHACNRTFDRGLHRSYRRERQRLPFVRGKIRVPETVRTLAPIPVTVESDVFDDNTTENQVLAATLQLVRTSSHVSDTTRRMAYRAFRQVRHVSALTQPLPSARSIVWNPQNEMYRQAVWLAELLLSATSIADDVSNAKAPGFVINSPMIVERWVRARLRKHWGLRIDEMPDSWNGVLWLDADRRVELKPDLAIRQKHAWKFVGDVKYKVLRADGARRDDVYQMLAYLSATGLSEGILIYAGIAGRDETLVLSHSDARIHVISIDLSSHEAGEQLLRKVDSYVDTESMSRNLSD